jgi:hypothetical protein
MRGSDSSCGTRVGPRWPLGVGMVLRCGFGCGGLVGGKGEGVPVVLCAGLQHEALGCDGCDGEGFEEVVE